MRLDIRRIGQVKQGDAVVGSRVRVKVVKNKLAPPFRDAEFELLYGVGVSRSTEVLDLSVANGLVEKSGAWYALEGERMAQGRERAAQWLAEHPSQMENLRERLLAVLKRGEATVRVPQAGADEGTASERCV